MVAQTESLRGYLVQKDENLSGIAHRFGMKLDELLAENRQFDKKSADGKGKNIDKERAKTLEGAGKRDADYVQAGETIKIREKAVVTQEPKAVEPQSLAPAAPALPPAAPKPDATAKPTAPAAITPVPTAPPVPAPSAPPAEAAPAAPPAAGSAPVTPPAVHQPALSNKEDNYSLYERDGTGRIVLAPPAPSGFLNVTNNGKIAPDGISDDSLSAAFQMPGAEVGRLAMRAFNLDEDLPITRSATQTGLGHGKTHYKPGEVSLLGIDNYELTAYDAAALGETGVLSYAIGGSQDGLHGHTTSKAESLLAHTMFNTQPNGGYRTNGISNIPSDPDEKFKVTFAQKGIFSLGNVTEIKTGDIYAGLQKKSVIANFAQLTTGVGVAVEGTNPFSDEGKKLGAEFSAVGDVVLGESKQMSAMGGGVWNRETGIYGFGFGFESRNRVAAMSIAFNEGADLGVVRGKFSQQVFASAKSLGVGATMHAAWNDKTGTLTLQAAAGLEFGLGGGFDLSGEIQSDYAVGLMANYVLPVVDGAADLAKKADKHLFGERV